MLTKGWQHGGSLLYHETMSQSCVSRVTYMLTTFSVCKIDFSFITFSIGSNKFLYFYIYTYGNYGLNSFKEYKGIGLTM